VVKQIGCDDEEGGLVSFDALIGDGHGQVSLPAATRPGEHQPALGVLGEAGGGGDALAEHLPAGAVWQWTYQIGGGECYSGQGAQIAISA